MQKINIQQARRLGFISNSLGKKTKYGNKKTSYKGFLFDSKKEAERAMELDSLKKKGVIISWFPQPEFKIIHNDVKICSYFADFSVQYHNGYVEYEDVKGVKTDVYKLKKKLVLAFHGITIKEI